MAYFLIIISAILVNNIVFTQFLGIIHLSSVSKKLTRQSAWVQPLSLCLFYPLLLPI